MQDHYLVDDDGSMRAVADLATWEVHDLLRDGVEPLTEVTREQFMERLRIEIVIREMLSEGQ